MSVSQSVNFSKFSLRPKSTYALHHFQKDENEVPENEVPKRQGSRWSRMQQKLGAVRKLRAKRSDDAVATVAHKNPEPKSKVEAVKGGFNRFRRGIKNKVVSGPRRALTCTGRGMGLLCDPVVRSRKIALVTVMGERSSGKSTLVNTITQEPYFPVGKGHLGLELMGPLPLVEFCQKQKIMSTKVAEEKYGNEGPVVILAEYSSKGPPNLIEACSLLRNSSVIIFNASLLMAEQGGVAGGAAFAWLQRWLGFIPALSVELRKKEADVLLGDLLTVIRDWDDASALSQESFERLLWDYEDIPASGAMGSAEELRNSIRFHIKALFRSQQTFFLPPPQKYKEIPGLSDHFKSVAATIGHNLAEAVDEMLDDDERTLTGQETWDRLDEEPDKSLPSLSGKAVAGSLQINQPQTWGDDGIRIWLMTSCARRVDELCHQELPLPQVPAALEQRFRAVVEKAARELYHKAVTLMPDTEAGKFLENLRMASEPVFQTLKRKNETLLEEAREWLSSAAAAEIEADWRSIPVPQPRHILEAAMDCAIADERLELHLERCLELSRHFEVHEAVMRKNKEQWKAIFRRTRNKVSEDVRLQVRGRNFQALNQWLIEHQQQTVERARVRLDEFRQRRPYALPMKEQLSRDEWLIDTMCCWAGDTVLRATARADEHRLVDIGRVNKLRKDLTYELRNLLMQAMGGPLVSPSERANVRSVPSSRRRPSRDAGKLVDLSDHLSGENDLNEKQTFTVDDVRAVFTNPDFRLGLLRRLREPDREVEQKVTPRCTRCKACLLPDPVPGECQYHPGEWIPGPIAGGAPQEGSPHNKRKWFKLGKSKKPDLYQVAVSVGGRWSCCDSGVQLSPGCLRGMHLRSKDETSAVVEICD